jgi:hypothetical protein
MTSTPGGSPSRPSSPRSTSCCRRLRVPSGTTGGTDRAGTERPARRKRPSPTGPDERGRARPRRVTVRGSPWPAGPLVPPNEAARASPAPVDRDPQRGHRREGARRGRPSRAKRRSSSMMGRVDTGPGSHRAGGGVVSPGADRDGHQVTVVGGDRIRAASPQDLSRWAPSRCSGLASQPERVARLDEGPPCSLVGPPTGGPPPRPTGGSGCMRLHGMTVRCRRTGPPWPPGHSEPPIIMLA